MTNNTHTPSLPLTSHEVRWFYDGGIDQHPALRHWFDAPGPIPRATGVGQPEWTSRLGGQPDIYLLVPGSDDMGIKWREGQLQIKGRVLTQGVRRFCGRHQGLVERWIKWSYPNLPAGFAGWFTQAQPTGLATVAVRKTRALRMIRLDLPTGAEEVRPTTVVDRGIGLELTALEGGGEPWCSLAFEAFPDDSRMEDEFTRNVTVLLESLKEIELQTDQSKSYPGWLRETFSGKDH